MTSWRWTSRWIYLAASGVSNLSGSEGWSSALGGGGVLLFYSVRLGLFFRKESTSDAWDFCAFVYLDFLHSGWEANWAMGVRNKNNCLLDDIPRDS